MKNMDTWTIIMAVIVLFGLVLLSGVATPGERQAFENVPACTQGDDVVDAVRCGWATVDRGR